MLSKRYQHHYSFLEPLKLTDTKKQSTSGALSPDTITTTSSGYSTGGSSVSTKIVPTVKDHNTHKIKSTSFHNLITKLKSFINSPKTKQFVSSTTSKEMSSVNILRQYSTSYDIPLSSSVTTSNTISLPFTYYHNSPIKKFEYNNKKSKESYVTKTTNFDKISAWLDHTEMMTHEEEDENDLLFIDELQQQSISPSPIDFDHKLIMKKSSSSNRTPQRSASMVSTMTRPIIEKTVSPTSSFSSSILVNGMSERMTPQKTYHLSRTSLTEGQTNILIPKSNRRRAIDFSRRRTVAGSTEQINNNNNKENLPNNRRQQIYRFSPSTSNNIVTKKYYFHSNPPVKTEDMLMNSYGLTLLQQQKRQTTSSSMTIPNISENNSIRSPPKQINRRPPIPIPQQEYTSDSLDDLLCDREVESYFYPNRRQSPISHPQHVYINLETPPKYYQSSSSSYLHGTLC